MAAFTVSKEFVGDSEVMLRCEFAVPPERVFRAWTDPELMVKWMCPAETALVTIEKSNLMVGGEYSISMHVAGGPQTVVGEYLEIDAPKRLVFTWQWSTNDSTPVASVVSVDFEATAVGCAMRLSHSKFVHPDVRDGHVEGWEMCLGRLNEALPLD